jgi:hypothetical protein
MYFVRMLRLTGYFPTLALLFDLFFHAINSVLVIAGFIIHPSGSSGLQLSSCVGSLAEDRPVNSL